LETPFAELLVEDDEGGVVGEEESGGVVGGFGRGEEGG